jgi:hypothetical protein
MVADLWLRVCGWFLYADGLWLIIMGSRFMADWYWLMVYGCWFVLMVKVDWYWMMFCVWVDGVWLTVSGLMVSGWLFTAHGLWLMVDDLWLVVFGWWSIVDDLCLMAKLYILCSPELTYQTI